MAEEKPPISLIEREGMDLSPEDKDEVEVEAFLGDMEMQPAPDSGEEEVPLEVEPLEVEPVEIIEEEDGGVTLDFDPRAEARESGDFYGNLADCLLYTSDAADE